MKIKKDILVNFIKKIKLNNNSIDEVIMDFTDHGLKCRAMDKLSIIRMDATLKKSAFIDYESIGKIGVQELPTLFNILNKFSGEVTIKVEGNLIMFSEGSRKIETELVDVQFINDIGDGKDLEFNESFEIDSEIIKTFSTDISINKETALLFQTVEKKLRMECEGKFKFKEDNVVPEMKGGVKVKFGEPLFAVIPCIDGKIQINLSTDYPCKFVETNDNMVISWIVAPRIREEDEE